MKIKEAFTNADGRWTAEAAVILAFVNHNNQTPGAKLVEVFDPEFGMTFAAAVASKAGR